MDPLSNIRRGQIQDLAAIDRIERASFGPEGFSRRQLRYLLQSPHAYWWLAQDQASACWLNVRRGRQTWGRLYSLAVHPEARGKGLARCLLDAGIHWLATEQLERCFAEVAVDNPVARSLYGRYGFRERGLLANYYGPGQDALSLVRERAAGSGCNGQRATGVRPSTVASVAVASPRAAYARRSVG